MSIPPLLLVKLGFLAVLDFSVEIYFGIRRKLLRRLSDKLSLPILLIFPMTGSVNLFIFTVKILFCVVSGAFSLFFCRLSMPPKRSNCLRNLSARAVAIAAAGESPRKKSRRAAVQP